MEAFWKLVLDQIIKYHCWPLYREPDSTYFELPPGSHPGDRSAPSTSVPNNRSEVCMDVYHMRDMNDNVMVGIKLIFIAQLYVKLIFFICI